MLGRAHQAKQASLTFREGVRLAFVDGWFNFVDFGGFILVLGWYGYEVRGRMGVMILVNGMGRFGEWYSIE